MVANMISIFSLIPIDTNTSGTKTRGFFSHSKSKLMMRIANGSTPMREIKLERKKVKIPAIKEDALVARNCFLDIV